MISKDITDTHLCQVNPAGIGWQLNAQDAFFGCHFIKRERIAATCSRYTWSILSKAAFSALSTSRTKVTSPLLKPGTTISDAVSAWQAIYPGNSDTSSTIMVSPFEAAVPHTPLPHWMTVQAGSPWNGPKPRVFPFLI